MAKLPAALPGPDAIRAFGKVGFRLDRINGSHHILVKPDHPVHLTVSFHGARGPVSRGVLRTSIRDAGITVDEFLALL